MIHTGGSLADYRSTLARLAPLVEAADTIVPGHGAPNDRETALRILDEDVDYLDALERGEEKPALPKGRDSGEQRDIHSRNLKVLSWVRAGRAAPFGQPGPGHGLSNAPEPPRRCRTAADRGQCRVRQRPSSPSPSVCRTAVTAWPVSAPARSASRTAASTPTAGTSPARWAVSGRNRSSSSTACGSASTASGSGRPPGSPAGGATPSSICPPPPGLTLQRTDFVPDGHRAALFGLKMTNPGASSRTVTVKVDAHSELMTEYPWGSAA